MIGFVAGGAGTIYRRNHPTGQSVGRLQRMSASVSYDRLQAMSDEVGDCLPVSYLFQETTMKKLLALLMSSAFAILAGCNTVAGAGKDLERGGEKVQDAAKDVQQQM